MLYADTILLSFVIAFATLAVTLVVGVPAAYALHARGGRLSRVIEEIITLPLAIPGPGDRAGAAADLWRFRRVSAVRGSSS